MTDLIQRLRSTRTHTGSLGKYEFDPDPMFIEAAGALEAADARIAEFERILDGLPQEAIDGGWTARGISAYAKQLETRVAELNAIIHTPESDEFLKGVSIEAEYQRQLHGVDDTDARFDWVQYFWVTGYLLNKALAACKSGEGNGEKAKHHLTTTAALISNWHNVLTGKPAACVHSNSGKPTADLIAARGASTGAVSDEGTDA
ncbi:hypothetical protein PQR64_23075 [Paraburkholderia phytofirmans]|uniref:hypothetical protein n=1 Tax=Paraburkholderia phytofirmans TaxID=261302 RepID=UPI0038BDEC22